MSSHLANKLADRKQLALFVAHKHQPLLDGLCRCIPIKYFIFLFLPVFAVLPLTDGEPDGVVHDRSHESLDGLWERR